MAKELVELQHYVLSNIQYNAKWFTLYSRNHKEQTKSGKIKLQLNLKNIHINVHETMKYP